MGSDALSLGCLKMRAIFPGFGRSSEGGHGNPLQYSCLENPHGQRSLAGCSPWGLKESNTTEATKHSTYKVMESGDLVMGVTL